MGVDLSLTSTGISVNEKTYAITTKLRGVERLIDISTRVVDIAIAHSPIAILVEGYSFGSKFTRAHAIGELGGAVKVALYGAGFAVIDVPPACRAKFASGRGNAPKAEVVMAVEAISGLHFSGSSADDVADAWVLEQMALAKLGESQYEWSKVQLSALEKVNWEPLYAILSKVGADK